MKENNISYLQTAISDAQELIRFCDTKTAIIITLIGAYILSFYSALDKIIEYASGYSFWFWFFIVLFIILLILCLIITTRIITPTNNPSENVNIDNKNIPPLKFFIAPNNYNKSNYFPFANSSKFKLNEIYETYTKEISDANEESIINSLSFELHKVSYIRNVKNDRFHILLWLLLATTISYLIAYLFFSIETHNTIEHLKLIAKLSGKK